MGLKNTMKPKEIKRLQARSRTLRAKVIAPNTVLVTSRSNPFVHHIVTVDVETDGTLHARCTCPWAQNRGIGCSHVMAALGHLAAQKKRAISFWLSLDEAKRQRHRILRLRGEGTAGDLFITSRPA
jgi:hypothetical protein